MNALGTPILGDDLYPDILDVSSGDFSRPLQLLAESIAFDDPISGDRRHFTTGRVLDRWSTGPVQGGYQGDPPSA